MRAGKCGKINSQKIKSVKHIDTCDKPSIFHIIWCLVFKTVLQCNTYSILYCNLDIRRLVSASLKYYCSEI